MNAVARNGRGGYTQSAASPLLVCVAGDQIRESGLMAVPGVAWGSPPMGVRLRAPYGEKPGLTPKGRTEPNVRTIGELLAPIIIASYVGVTAMPTLTPHS